MNKIFTLAFILFCFTSKAQQFNGTGGAITNNGIPTNFPVSVSGLSQSQLNGTFGIETVCLSINHPDVAELYIYLQSPSGMKVELSNGNSCHGSNYTSTCFNSSQSTSVTLGSAPYSGNYKPTG